MIGPVVRMEVAAEKGSDVLTQLYAIELQARLSTSYEELVERLGTEEASRILGEVLRDATSGREGW